ncbi:MAG: hypothetical protein K0R14_531 [Burkholderiales bacterium]|jgi:hypothetical protein|nr:hypothetical protein [Burkholderiales bacterium]
MTKILKLTFLSFLIQLGMSSYANAGNKLDTTPTYTNYKICVDSSDVSVTYSLGEYGTDNVGTRHRLGIGQCTMVSLPSSVKAWNVYAWINGGYYALGYTSAKCIGLTWDEFAPLPKLVDCLGNRNSL